MPIEIGAQIYENYDRAFVDYIHALRYNDRPLLCVFATPERAMAQVQKHIRDKTGEDLKVIPLPFASISRTAEVFDHSRFVEFTLRRDYWDNRSRRYFQVKRPQPMNLTYQVHIWGRLLRDIDYLKTELLTSLRANEIYLPVNHSEPLGLQIIHTTLESIDDASSYETEERQRILRKVFVFMMKGWVCYPFRDPYIVGVGPVEAISVEVDRSDDLETVDEVLDQFTVSDS